MNYSKSLLINISVLVIVATGAFFGGSAYGKHQATTTRTGSFATNGQRGSFTGGQFGGQQGGTSRTAFGGVASGTILSKDATSITIKLADGGSRIVLFGTSTPVVKSTTGSLADLSVGDQVVASGTANQDGSITAQSIVLGSFPFGGRMFGVPTEGK